MSKTQSQKQKQVFIIYPSDLPDTTPQKYEIAITGLALRITVINNLKAMYRELNGIQNSKKFFVVQPVPKLVYKDLIVASMKKKDKIFTLR